jgi:hypothetical protein
MVLNATFNNISDMSWHSVLLVEETGGPGENHRLVTSLQLPMQAVPITTDGVSSNLDQGEVYNIM